jgi:hypothetical protein
VTTDTQLVAAVVDGHYDSLVAVDLAWLPEPPSQMVIGEPNPDGWVRWHTVPSPVTDADLAAVEAWLPARLPSAMKTYFTYRCILMTDRLMLPEVPADDPLGPFVAEAKAWAPLLEAGYIPFAEFGDGYGPVCLDTRQPNGDDYAVGWIDHEHFHHLPDADWSNRSAICRLFQPLFPTFRSLLEAARVVTMPVSS